MLTLLQLDAESPGSVDPELAASICEMDRGLILELLTWNSEQEAAWRQMRGALRIVVERELGRRREPGEASYDEPPRPATEKVSLDVARLGRPGRSICWFAGQLIAQRVHNVLWRHLPAPV